MKNSFYYRTISVLLTTIIFFFSLSTGFAKSIDLYDKPKDGKPIAKLDTETGVIHIFTPKDSTWVKVADPKNGNVGWVKSTELNHIPVQMNVMNSTKNSGQHYHMIQIGNPAPAAIPISHVMQQQMNAMTQMMNAFQYDWMGFPGWANTPVYMPVIVLPVKEQAKPATKK